MEMQLLFTDWIFLHFDAFFLLSVTSPPVLPLVPSAAWVNMNTQCHIQRKCQVVTGIP